MAGDKIFRQSQNEYGETMNDQSEINLSLSSEDEVESIESIPCPEFQFSTSACYMCNGYYGPCFEEPVCATCHAFLFPDYIGLLKVPIFSEKTDDEDSGNDEPIDIYYNHERRTSQQHQNLPQNSANPNIPNVQDGYNHNLEALPHSYYQNPLTLRNNNVSRESVVRNVPIFHSVCKPQCENSDFHPNPHQDANCPSSRVSLGQSPNPEFEHDDKPNSGGEPHCAIPWNFRMQENNVEEPPKHSSISERLDMLTNPKRVEHEPINEPGLVERLPPEVLLAVFSYLDDVSLWCSANVCRRWYGLLSTHITPQQWQQHVKLRWPLYRPISFVNNWYKVYDHLASSAPCRTCLTQITLRSRMEENSWRGNRLRSELKSLRVDPPEGIEAFPLDQMCCHWQATITGPVGSPYEGGLFYLYLQVPYGYPMCPPVVRFLTKILHPNVSRHGDVGIDSIHHNWSLALTLSKVLISVQSLLTDPYCQVCMEPELGELYINDRERFEEVARSWTWKYAMHDVVTPT